MKTVIFCLVLLQFIYQARASQDHECQEPLISQIRQLELESVSEIQDWIIQLKSYYSSSDSSTLNFDNSQKSSEQMAIDMLECTSRVLKRGLRYQCHYQEWWNGNTFPILGRLVKLSYVFPILSPGSQRGILIHEATHKCGSNDLERFNERNEPPRTTWKSHWAYVASTYEYWAKFGFCHPDHEGCPRN